MSTLLWPQYAWDDSDSDESDDESNPKKPTVISHHVYQRTDKDDPDRLCLQIVDREFFCKGNASIYRAMLRCDGQADRDVVCKMVSGETNIVRLADEAEFYLFEL